MRPNTTTTFVLLIGAALTMPTHLLASGENDRRALGKNVLQATTRQVAGANIVSKRDGANEKRLPSPQSDIGDLAAGVEEQAAVLKALENIEATVTSDETLLEIARVDGQTTPGKRDGANEKGSFFQN